jgi:hypothetical protein
MKASKKGFNINQEILGNLSNIENLVVKLSSNIRNPKLSSQVVFRAIYKILENDEKTALTMIDNYKCNLNNKSYLALIIKIYALNNMFDEALKIYNNIPDNLKKKRFIIVIYDQLIKVDKYKAFSLLHTRIYKNFVLTEDDIKKVYDIKYFNEIMKMLSDNEIIIKDTSFFKNNGMITSIFSSNCINLIKKLKKFQLTEPQKYNLKCNILANYITKISRPHIDKLNVFLKTNRFNMFIDGNNVLFFKDREVNIDSFRRLNIIYNKVKDKYTPLFFIHMRHRKAVNRFGMFRDEANFIISQLPIYWTPYKMNDDWFFIWSGLSVMNSYVLTNDLLRDHIYKISEESLISNTLSVWKNNSIVKYELVDNDYKIIYPLEYSVKVQCVDEHWHIPVTGGKWICI